MCCLQAFRDGAPLPHWTPDEAKLFFNAYEKYNSPKGVLWEKVCSSTNPLISVSFKPTPPDS